MKVKTSEQLATNRSLQIKQRHAQLTNHALSAICIETQPQSKQRAPMHR